MGKHKHLPFLRTLQQSCETIRQSLQTLQTVQQQQVELLANCISTIQSKHADLLPPALQVAPTLPYSSTNLQNMALILNETLTTTLLQIEKILQEADKQDFDTDFYL